MLVQYPCAMQRRNIYRWRIEDVFKYAVIALLVLQIRIDVVTPAPASYDTSLPKSSEISEYFSDVSGCYYNFQRYEEGDRIVTNEPCLNCTCHNRMLMCYLRVCPFTKAIGQDCTIEKKPDQCCPIISCPEVPVKLLTSSTTSSPTPTTPTTVGFHDNYGCTIHDSFYADGAQVPSDPGKPCELCYCIRNRTACVMQECTLHVEGCKPVYQDGVCCPVRYDCDYEKEFTSTSHTQTIDGNIVKSTTYASVVDCQFRNQSYSDGELITTDKPCEHCYCMRGDIVCAVQECGEPLRGKDCVPTMPPPGLCCPSSYDCTNDTSSTEGITEAPKPFSMDYPPQFSSIESSPAPSRTPAVLSQEQIYEKLGELTSLPSSTNLSTIGSKTTVSWSEESSTAHPSEDIQFDSHTVDVSEYSSTEREESTASSAIEKLTTAVKEAQPVDYGTEKSPSYNPSSLSALPETTTVNVEVTTDAPVTSGSAKITKTPAPMADGEDNLSTDQPSHSEDTTANVHIYESTKSPAETTKFESNHVHDKVTETISYGNPTTEGNNNEIRETTIYASSALENEFASSEPSSSSEASRYTFTTREFDRSTAVMKEEMATKFVEEIVTTMSSASDSHQQTHEGETDDTNSIPERTTLLPTTRETSTYMSNDNSIEKGVSMTTTEEATTAQSGIPGEGSCLVDGITYPNTSVIDSSNPCHQKCLCISSIPTCTLVSCQAPPSDPKCMPVQIKPESCCPVYICSSDEHEQAPPAQIPSENQFAPHTEQGQIAPQLVHDNQEEHDNSEDESSSTDDHLLEEVAQSSSVSTPNEVTAFEKEPSKDPKLPLSSLQTLSASSTPPYIQDTTILNSDSTEAVQPDTITEPPSIYQTHKPIVVDDNVVDDNNYQKVTHAESSSRFPPIVVTELQEASTEASISSSSSSSSSDHKEAQSSSASVVTEQTIFTTVTEKDAGEVGETTITSVSSDDTPQEHTQQDREPSSKKPSLPTKFVTEVVTEEAVTEQVELSSEPAAWSEGENKTQSEAPNYTLHTTYPPPSSSSEHSESIHSIATLSSTYSDAYSTSSPSLEDEESTTLMGSVDSPSTVKETEAEMNTTSKPDDKDAQTTLHSEYETSPTNKDSYSSPEPSPSNTSSEKPNEGAQDETVVTSTAASETTNFPHEEAAAHHPLNLTTNEVESMDVPSENVPEPVVTSSPTEASSKFSSVTESTYPKKSQHSPSTTITNLLSSTEYEEIKTTLSPSATSKNGHEVSSTPAPISDESLTTKSSETINEISSEDVAPSVSESQTTSAPIHANVTEKVALPSSSETSTTYNPIQHSTWTPKPLDNIGSFGSSSSSADVTGTTSSDANLSAQSSSNSTGGSSSVNGSDSSSMEEYDEEPNAFGPGTCRYNGKQYISAQQIPRDDPCDFCFCFRSDIICLQQSCPPPIHGCRQEPIQGFCCPRYECPVARDLASNITLQMTTTEVTSPITSAMHPLRTARVPHRGGARRTGCVINGYFYNVGDDISIASGPCLECTCGSDGRMKCDPKSCSPEPYVQQMMAESSYRKR